MTSSQRAFVLHPLVEGVVVVLAVREHPPDLAHRLALQPAEQLLRPPWRRPRRRPSPARPAATPCCPRRCGACGRRRSWRCPGPAARRRRWCPPTGCPRWRWSGASTASPAVRTLRAEQVVDGVEGAVVPPLVEVPPDGALGREVLGQVAPLAAGAQDVEDGIDDVPQVGLAGPPAGVDGDVRLDQRPLLVGHVAGVGLRSHPILRARPPTPYGTDSSPRRRGEACPATRTTPTAATSRPWWAGSPSAASTCPTATRPRGRSSTTS